MYCNVDLDLIMFSNGMCLSELECTNRTEREVDPITCLDKQQ